MTEAVFTSSCQSRQQTCSHHHSVPSGCSWRKRGTLQAQARRGPTLLDAGSIVLKT